MSDNVIPDESEKIFCLLRRYNTKYYIVASRPDGSIAYARSIDPSTFSTYEEYVEARSQALRQTRKKFPQCSIIQYQGGADLWDTLCMWQDDLKKGRDD